MILGDRLTYIPVCYSIPFVNFFPFLIAFFVVVLGQDKNKKLRPLYDIPYMFEAREFLRKKLIGKKVSDEHAFVNVWTRSHALGAIILDEVLSRLFSSRGYSRPSLVKLL